MPERHDCCRNSINIESPSAYFYTVFNSKFTRMLLVEPIKFHNVEINPHLIHSLFYKTYFCCFMHLPHREHCPLSKINSTRLRAWIIFTMLSKNDESDWKQANAPLVSIILQ